MPPQFQKTLAKAQIGKISYSNLKTKPRSSLVVLCLGLGTFIALTWVQFLVGELRSTSHLLSLGLLRCYLQLTLPTRRSKPSSQTAGSSSDMVFPAAHFGLFSFLCCRAVPHCLHLLPSPILDRLLEVVS